MLALSYLLMINNTIILYTIIFRHTNKYFTYYKRNSMIHQSYHKCIYYNTILPHYVTYSKIKVILIKFVFTLLA